MLSSLFFIFKFAVWVWSREAFAIDWRFFCDDRIIWFKWWNVMLKLLFLLNELQSFLNFFLLFLSLILRLLLFYLLHIMFKPLFECFLFSLFLRYETINEILWSSQSLFIIIVYIFHIIVFAKILSRSHCQIFLKSNFTESLVSIRYILRHLRSCLIPWI